MGQAVSASDIQYGFIETSHDVLDTVTTDVPGVFATGASVGPADLDDSISSAGAAAAKAVALLRSAKVPV